MVVFTPIATHFKFRTLVVAMINDKVSFNFMAAKIFDILFFAGYYSHVELLHVMYQVFDLIKELGRVLAPLMRKLE